MVNISVKFQQNRKKTVGGVPHTRYTLSTHFHCKMPVKRLSSNCEKESKMNLQIISKPHVYLRSIIETYVKFKKNRNKTVGVAHKRYPLSIHFHCQNTRLSSNCKKRVKNYFEDYIQYTCISSDHGQGIS